MKEKLILVGGGGHCRSVIEVIESGGLFEIAGIVDVKEKAGTEIYGYKIIGSDDDLPQLIREFKNFHITLGQIKSGMKRRKLFEQVKSSGGNFPVLKSGSVIVSEYCAIGEGSILMHRSFLNAGVIVGKNTIINTGAIIEHDTQIGNDTHISTSAVVNGTCIIGDNCFIGSNSVISHGIKIGSNCIIGAGSVVIRDIEDGITAAGNPAKKLH